AVADAAAGEQQAGEHDGVGVDDPLQLAGRGGDRAPEGGEGDVEDGGVDGDEHHRQAEHAEGPPAAGIGRDRDGGGGGRGAGGQARRDGGGGPGAGGRGGGV